MYLIKIIILFMRLLSHFQDAKVIFLNGIKKNILIKKNYY